MGIFLVNSSNFKDNWPTPQSTPSQNHVKKNFKKITSTDATSIGFCNPLNLLGRQFEVVKVLG